MVRPSLHEIAILHRWLGIAGGWLFLAWFASGIVMIYARMPALDPIDQLGSRLILPPKFEPHRDAIAERLTPLPDVARA